MKGVWRTIRGRRVFIEEGQTLTQAMKNSNKFYKNIKEPTYFEGKYKIKVDDALKKVNPNNYKKNCQRCVPTFMESLRDGKEYIAKDRPQNINYIDANCEKLYEGVNSWRDWNLIYSNSSGIREINKAIKDAGDGAVFEIYVKWNKNSGGYGKAHVFAGINDNGIIKFVDPQDGNNDCKYYITKYSMWGSTMYLRIDDKKLKDQYRDLIFEEKK